MINMYHPDIAYFLGRTALRVLSLSLSLYVEFERQKNNTLGAHIAKPRAFLQCKLEILLGMRVNSRLECNIIL